MTLGAIVIEASYDDADRSLNRLCGLRGNVLLLLVAAIARAAVAVVTVAEVAVAVLAFGAAVAVLLA